MGHIYPLSSSDFRTPETATLNSRSIKIKAFVDAYLLPHVCHTLQALAHAKVTIMKLLQDCNSSGGKKSSNTCRQLAKLKKKRTKKRSVFQFIKAHFSWSSSYVIPEPSTYEGFDVSRMYYDATWDSMISTEAAMGDDQPPPALSGYLHCLDQEKDVSSHEDDDRGCEIDRLAEKFIASCHEKFRLEKQESYRRYQEMLARSL